MPLKIAALLLAASLAASSGAFAEDPDDGYAWINNCMAANMKKGASDDVAHSYCACIDHEMGDDEVNNIAGWETSNPVKVAECRYAVDWR
jgi:hypothetical protein